VHICFGVGGSGMNLQIVDVKASDPVAVALLEDFYTKKYLQEFSDPEEQASFDSMLETLKTESSSNTFKVIMFVNGKEVAGIVAVNYVHSIRVLLIEFLLVESSYRSLGLGRKLIDAAKLEFPDLDCIVCEINDPRYIYDDSFCDLDRMRVWQKYGFKKLDFNYIQPSLSDDKEPVENMMLMCSSKALYLPSDLVLEIVRSYMKYAMSITDVDENEAYLRMKASLRGISEVRLLTV
jgi:GNAT superfamily N-acetyltransferase